MPSKYVIHTVEPIIYEDVTEKEILYLKNCYINSLELALEYLMKNNGIVDAEIKTESELESGSNFIVIFKEYMEKIN